MSKEFDWYGKDESIVLKPMDATAVYSNEAGDIVIRQQMNSGMDDDSIVIIPKIFGQTLIDAIKREIAKEN